MSNKRDTVTLYGKSVSHIQTVHYLFVLIPEWMAMRPIVQMSPSWIRDWNIENIEYEGAYYQWTVL